MGKSGRKYEGDYGKYNEVKYWIRLRRKIVIWVKEKYGNDEKEKDEREI